MKMLDTDFQGLSNSINAVVSNFPNVSILYKKNGLTHERYRWDVFYVSKIDKKLFYEYLNDSHIDTALRKILGANW
jgi:hypothetical protein